MIVPPESNETVFTHRMGSVIIELVQGQLACESTDLLIVLNDGLLKHESNQAQAVLDKAGPAYMKDCNTIVAERFKKPMPEGSL